MTSRFFSFVITCATSVYNTMKRCFESEEWVRIGKLSSIYIYPLDGGVAEKINQALCTENGLQFNNVPDRSLLYSSESNRNEVSFSPPPTQQPTMTELYSLFHSLSYVISIRERTMTYYGDYVRVNDYRDPTQNILHVSYMPPKRRSIFTKGVRCGLINREGKFPDRFAPNYSSYTLVTYKSLRALRSRTDANVPSTTFRPHFEVFDSRDLPPYFEDNIIAVRIGDVEFDQINPCTHHSSYLTPLGTGDGNLFNVFRRHRRTLKYLRPDLAKTDSPVFGINMELVEDNSNNSSNTFHKKLKYVRLDDEVYALLRNPYSFYAIYDYIKKRFITKRAIKRQ